MAHWSDNYIGRRYIEGEFDCAELARTVQREVFGREIALPSNRDYSDKDTTIGKVRAMAAQVEREKDKYAERVEVPQDGDAVLLVSRGHLEHIGTYCLIEGQPYVLHAASAYGHAVRTHLRQIPLHNMKVEGFYRWI